MILVDFFFLLFSFNVMAQTPDLSKVSPDQMKAMQQQLLEELQKQQMQQQLQQQMQQFQQQQQMQQFQSQQFPPQQYQQQNFQQQPDNMQPAQDPQSGGAPANEIKLPKGPAKAGPYTSQNPGVNNSKELEKRLNNRIKDPFMLPGHLYLKIKRKLGDVQGEGYVDESVEPQRRWALKRYKLVAIIWNVKKPKAMILDLQNNMHMFYVNDRIGNGEGVITSIGNGEVVVDEKGNETRMKMNK